MKSSIQQELHLFAEELQRQVSTDTLERLAKETGFVQRSSKYRGQDLVSLCVWLSQRIASAPLTKLCSELEDSTLFQIPSSLAAFYPGSGGCGQKAGVKIQLEYDLHSGTFLNLQVEPGKNNDKTYGTHCLDTLRPGDLCLRDLGYFSLEDHSISKCRHSRMWHTWYTQDAMERFIFD